MSPAENQDLRVKHRLLGYFLVSLVLSVFCVLIREKPWPGGTESHTAMEVPAAFLALMVGSMALVRFYVKNAGSLLR